MSASTALEVRDLTGPARAVEISEISLVVGAGQACLVLGPIHSGKSVLMRHLLGLECAASGTIIIAGESFDARGESEIVLRRMRTRMGVIFEGSALVSRISAIENVELPLLEHTSATAAEARETARALLDEVGIEPSDDIMPLELGRAEQRRVALARALALRPPIVLMDEPTLGLDSHSAHELDDTIARVQKSYGFGLLTFSHEVRHAFGRVQHIYVMADGMIVANGTREALRRHPAPVVQQLLNRRGQA